MPRADANLTREPLQIVLNPSPQLSMTLLQINRLSTYKIAHFYNTFTAFDEDGAFTFNADRKIYRSLYRPSRMQKNDGTT